MRFWKLFTRDLKETYRDIPALGFLLAFPLLFMVVFGAAFSSADQIDFLAPGIIVFGLLIMIPTSARILARDREDGYLARLLTTPARPWEFILGYSLCMSVVAIVQIFFFMLIARLYNVHFTGSLALAFLIFLLTALASIGVGMIVGSISKSENQAEPLTWLFAMPLAVLSGVWFSTSSMPSYLRTIADIFPYAHSVNAARDVINSGAAFGAMQNDVIVLAGWAVGSFLLGIFYFARTMRS
jgi:ABC-2 type transport system permease protein